MEDLDNESLVAVLLCLLAVFATCFYLVPVVLG